MNAGLIFKKCFHPQKVETAFQLSVKQKHPSALCVQFAEKYGNIFSLRIMGGRVVVINGYKHVREALVQKGEDLADRPVIPLFDEFVKNRGYLHFVF